MRPLETMAAVFVMGPLLATTACQVVSGADDFTFSGAGGANAGGMGGSAGGSEDVGGMGGEMPVAECELASDCPGLESDCRKRTCIDSTCGTENVGANQTCDDDGGFACNGQGACVQCFMDEECNEPIEKCSMGQCVLADCANGSTDGDETDLDCGGPTCLPCAVARQCNEATDCLSGFCADGAGGTGGGDSSSICTACDGNEDCGGVPDTWCDPKTDGGTCVPERIDGDACDDDAQCGSGHCVDGTCCEEACDGTCEACSTNRTGQPNGECRAIPDGNDPDSECFLLTPVCNGSRGCGGLL